VLTFPVSVIIIVQEGEVGHEMFFVVSGTAEIFFEAVLDSDGVTVHIKTIPLLISPQLTAVN